MKIILDINNKILKLLENERPIFKGEYSADKLILLINKTLVNEYPVITGLLSNGRKIGPYTTDSSYGSEIIDGVTYTTAEFTLSKENGFTLTEGNTQVTIWIYKTSNGEVVSKTAIGNITFNVVNTTAFNEGDVIISGDEEGAFVNLKVEIENLQSVVNELNIKVSKVGIIDMGTFATNRPIEEGLKEFFIAAENLNLDYYDNRVFIGLVADTKVMAIGQAGGGLAVYTENFKQYNVGYDDADVLAVEYATSIIQLADVCSWDTSIDDTDMEAMLKGIANQLYQWYLLNNINTYELGNEKSVVFTGRIYENPYIATFKVDDGFEVFIHCFGIWNYDTKTYEVKDYYVRRGNEDNITVTDLTSYTKTEIDSIMSAVNERLLNSIVNLGTFNTESTQEENRKVFAQTIATQSETTNATIYTGLIGSLKSPAFAQYEYGNGYVYIYESREGNASFFNRFIYSVTGGRVLLVGDYSSYTKTEVDTKLNTKADKADTYTKTEVDTKFDEKTIENLTLEYSSDKNLAYQLLTLFKNGTINRDTQYCVNKRFNIMVSCSYGDNFQINMNVIDYLARHVKSNYIDITTDFTEEDVTITYVYWYTKDEINTRLSTKADLVDGKVPSSQLPSYVDDVVEVDTYTNLPSAGETGKIYVTLDTNITYRWSGTQYVEISPSLALGETSSTAYAGNKGKANADAISDLQDDVVNLSSNIKANTDSISGLEGELANKQDLLTAGENITIVGNVISSVGGGGVSEEDVMTIIENNAEQTDTLEVEDATEIAIATSETFDSTSDEQIPTSKAVSDFVASSGSKLYRHSLSFKVSISGDVVYACGTIITSQSEVYDLTTLYDYAKTIPHILVTGTLFRANTNTIYHAVKCYAEYNSIYITLKGYKYNYENETVVITTALTNSTVSLLTDTVTEL